MLVVLETGYPFAWGVRGHNILVWLAICTFASSHVCDIARNVLLQDWVLRVLCLCDIKYMYWILFCNKKSRYGRYQHTNTCNCAEHAYIFCVLHFLYIIGGDGMYSNNKSRWGRSEAMIGSSHPLDPPQEATGPIKRWSYMTMPIIFWSILIYIYIPLY